MEQDGVLGISQNFVICFQVRGNTARSNGDLSIRHRGCQKTHKIKPRLQSNEVISANLLQKAGNCHAEDVNKAISKRQILVRVRPQEILCKTE